MTYAPRTQEIGQPDLQKLELFMYKCVTKMAEPWPRRRERKAQISRTQLYQKLGSPKIQTWLRKWQDRNITSKQYIHGTHTPEHNNGQETWKPNGKKNGNDANNYAGIVYVEHHNKRLI